MMLFKRGIYLTTLATMGCLIAHTTNGQLVGVYSYVPVQTIYLETPVKYTISITTPSYGHKWFGLGFMAPVSFTNEPLPLLQCILSFPDQKRPSFRGC